MFNQISTRFICARAERLCAVLLPNADVIISIVTGIPQLRIPAHELRDDQKTAGYIEDSNEKMPVWRMKMIKFQARETYVETVTRKEQPL